MWVSNFARNLFFDTSAFGCRWLQTRNWVHSDQGSINLTERQSAAHFNDAHQFPGWVIISLI